MSSNQSNDSKGLPRVPSESIYANQVGLVKGQELKRSNSGLEVVEENGHDHRGNWGSKIEFLLACIGNMVGLGNVWRFPYLAFENGGGAFVIPYIIMIFLIGIPILLLETSLGQYTAMGPVHAYANLSPLFQGLGVASIITSGLIAIYYNVILAWSLLYLFETFRGQKWGSCGNHFNTPNCIELIKVARNEVIALNTSIQSTREFFDYHILKRSDSISDISTPNASLLIALLISWIIVILALSKGVKSTGKVVYFTALFPYFLLIILFIRGVTLEGAGDGLKYYITPDFNKIGDLGVWRAAIVQVFFSVGGGVGIMLTYGSYNKFHNTLVKDTMLLAIGDMLTSVFAGAVVFSMIGFVAAKLNIPVHKILRQGDGVGLAFIVIPDGLSQMPLSIVWAASFFFMLFLLGIDSSFGYVENVTSFFFDVMRDKKKSVNKPLIVSLTGAFLFLCGLPMTTSAGIYFFEILDYFAAGIPVLFVGFLECIVVAHIYSMEEFLDDLRYMTGYQPSAKTKAHFMVALWTVAPSLIFVIILNDMYSLVVNTSQGIFNGRPTPGWALAIGWLVAFGPLAALPAGMIRYVRSFSPDSKKTFWEKVKFGLKHSARFKDNAHKSGEFGSKETMVRKTDSSGS
ncbi:Sodium- and chloride-dependent GABA transporter 2 [Halotydeus destructor]|nr:Sodium- and chloride-dependent GABA transporter 2 [Halotydeus destructor]